MLKFRLNPWLRLELTHALALILFLVAGVLFLGAVWIGLAFTGAAVPVIAPEESISLFLWETALICCSCALAFSSRTLVVREWLGVVNAARPKNAEGLHRWIVGTGLIMAWSALLVPLFVAALLSISAWMAIVIMGMVAAAFRGLTSGHAAMTEYTVAKQGSPNPKGGRFPLFWLATSIALLGAGTFSAYSLSPIILSARVALAKPIQAQLEVVKYQADGARAELPVLQQAYAARIEVETDALRRETSQMRKGVGSSSDEHAARSRLLQAQIEALKAVSEARGLQARLEKEKIELETHLVSSQSLAPSLKASR